jgi:hypothetical protein
MKIVNLLFIILIIFESFKWRTVIIAKETEKNFKKISKLAKNKVNNNDQDKKNSTNPFMKRFRDNMKEIATKRLKSDNLYQKRLQSGQLPEGYPDSMVREARKFRENKENWKHLMSFPTEVWRGCVYPPNKMNYLNWCRSLYASKTELEIKCNK